MTTQRWTLVEAAILHARTPAQTIGGTGSSLHSPRPLNPSEATELLSDDTPLELALKLNIDVLEVATPTLSRHWTWRNNARCSAMSSGGRVWGLRLPARRC